MYGTETSFWTRLRQFDESVRISFRLAVIKTSTSMFSHDRRFVIAPIEHDQRFH